MRDTYNLVLKEILSNFCELRSLLVDCHFQYNNPKRNNRPSQAQIAEMTGRQILNPDNALASEQAVSIELRGLFLIFGF